MPRSTGTKGAWLRYEGDVVSTAIILSIIVVCCALITGMIIVAILKRLALGLAGAYARKRDAFFKDLILHAISNTNDAQRLREMARRVYRRRWGGAPGLRPFDVWSLERSLLRVASELRGSSRQILTDMFEDAGGLARSLRQLRSPRCCQRLAAIHKLRIMHSRQAVPELIRALNDRSRIVRHAALRALGEIGDERAYPLLLNALENRARWSTLWVADSVLAAGAGMTPLLVERLTQVHDPQIRAIYARLLGLLRDPAAGPHLIPLLDVPEPRLRIAAIDTLSVIGGIDIAGRLRALLDEPHWEIRAAAARALGALRDVESAPLLKRLLDDPVYFVRDSAAQTLITLGDDGQAVLRAMIKASHPDALPLPGRR